jgi:glyoxylase-like metal-dependent hydrolase (beta-lactamase superfamily II)
MQLTEKIYCYPWRGRGNNCNTYVYAGEKVVLIDPGHIRNEFRENCLENLLTALQQDGFNIDMFDLILCTHGHGDHCEAATAIKKKKQINVAMHKDEEKHMVQLARFFDRLTGQNTALPEIDIFLQEGELEARAGGKGNNSGYTYSRALSRFLKLLFPRGKGFDYRRCCFQRKHRQDGFS